VQVFRRGLLHTKGTRQRVEWREAAAWLLTETDDDRIGTLNWTCAHLGLEPGYIRRVALCGEPLPRLRHFVSRDPAGGNGPKPLRSAVGERS
jgi:hypothetical protein